MQAIDFLSSDCANLLKLTATMRSENYTLNEGATKLLNEVEKLNLLLCYKSEQMTEEQWQSHLEDKQFAAWLNARGL